MKSWEIHNLKVDEYIKNHQSKYGYLDYLKLKKSQDEEAKKFGFKNYKEYLEYEEEHWELSIGEVLQGPTGSIFGADKQIIFI